MARFNKSILRPIFFALALSAWAAESNQAIAEEISNVAVFDDAWNHTRRYFYDKRVLGPEWEAIGERYRPQAAAAKSDAELSAVINAMLGELKTSHVRHLTKEEPEYYWLADAFARLHPQDYLWWAGHNLVRYPSIGIITRNHANHVFVSGVLEGLPAARAGVLVGDEVLSVDGLPFSPVASFSEKTGIAVTVTVKRAPDEAPLNLTVVSELLNPQEMFMRAMVNSAHVIRIRNVRIAYIRVWSYANRDYHRALEHELAQGALADADALIWDLRGGIGGAEPGYLWTFGNVIPTMAQGPRNGKWYRAYPKPYEATLKWEKPVIMLINDETRSGKEVLAYGFKNYHYGELIGTRTARSVMGSRIYRLKDDSILLLALSDVKVDGERLEGRGVEPTIEVPFKLEYSAGHDPQLERAIEELVRKLAPDAQNSHSKS